ncbi:MAG: flagellar export chaperone FliS [Legionella sp.]|nr:flagellar export chaperone FliS [Legionella sp.]
MNRAQIYSEIEEYSEVLGASPHRLIEMLIDKSLVNISQASMAIKMKQTLQKRTSICKANDIVIYLRDCLDDSADPVLVKKIAGIYTHVERQLFRANSTDNLAALEECTTIMNNIKIWWNNVAH